MIIKGAKSSTTKIGRAWLVLAMLLVAVGYKILNKKKHSAKTASSPIVYCSMEFVEGEQYIENAVRFGGGLTQTDELAKSGKYASVLDGDTIGFEYVLKNPLPGKTYKASIWKRSDDLKNSYLAVSNSDGSLFFETNQAVENNGTFWFKHQIVFTVPSKQSKQTIRIYTYKKSGTPKVYFDDFLFEEVRGVRAMQNDTEFTPKTIQIQIEKSAEQKLNEIKKRAQKAGLYVKQDDDFVKARLFDQNRFKMAKIRFKGDWLDHLSWKGESYRVEMNKNESWNGLQIFSVQRPEVRGNLREWVYHRMLDYEDVLTPRYDFIYFQLNDRKKKLYVFEEHFTKNLLEYKLRREGPIMKFDESRFWDGIRRHQDLFGTLADIKNKNEAFRTAEIRAFKSKKIAKNPGLKKQYDQAKNLMLQYKKGLQPAAQIFDIERMAKYIAITDICLANHALTWHNQRFYYNPITNLLEPIGFDGFGGQDIASELYTDEVFDTTNQRVEPLYRLFMDHEFLRHYFRQLMRLSDLDYISVFLAQLEEGLALRENLIRETNPNYVYNRDEIVHKAKKIIFESKPYQNSIQSYVQNHGRDSIILTLVNKHKLPIEVHLSQKPKDRFVLLPDNFTKKTFKITIPKHIKTLRFGLPGIKPNFNHRFSSFGPPKNETARQKLLGMDAFDVLKTNNGTDYYFKSPEVIVQHPIYVNKNTKLHIEPGAHLRFKNRGAIISESSIQWMGTKTKPITFESIDGKSGAIAVLQADSLSILKHCAFKNQNTLDVDNWFLTGAVSFYESNVTIEDCLFSSNQCEDALNVVKSTFSLKNSQFVHTFSDAFDADYSDGIIADCHFYHTGNDALDFSTSTIRVVDCTMESIGDKAISVGEQATVEAKNLIINQAVTALASKDKSSLTVDSVAMQHCNTGFAAYQKKPEFGPASIHCGYFSYDDVEHLFMIEPNSQFVKK